MKFSDSSSLQLGPEENCKVGFHENSAMVGSDGNISCQIMYEVTCELPCCCVSQNILFMISQATREFYDSELSTKKTHS